MTCPLPLPSWFRKLPNGLDWIGLHSTLGGRRIQDMLITINSCFQEKAPTPIVYLLKVKDTKYINFLPRAVKASVKFEKENKQKPS